MRKISLKTKILLILLGSLLVSALAVIVTLRIIVDSRSKNELQSLINSNVSSFETDVEEVLGEAFLFNMSLFQNVDEKVLTLFTNNAPREEKETALTSIMNSIGYNDEIFTSIRISDQTNMFYFGLDNKNILDPSPAFINKLFKAENDSFYPGEVVYDLDGNPSIIIGKPVINLRAQRIVATLFIYIRLDAITPISNDNGYIFATDKDNTIIFHPDISLINSTPSDFFFSDEEPYEIKTIENQRVILVNTTILMDSFYINDGELAVISIYYYNIVFEATNILNWYLIGSILTVVLVSVLLAIFLSKSLTTSINSLILNLRDFMSSRKKKHSDKKYPNDEIGELEKTYDDMIDKIIELINQNVLDQEAKRKLELDALQMQINPHFLYNTLDAIAWMAKIKKESEIEKLVLALARFFRISLHKGDKFVMIYEEIELIKHFLDIELIRFPDKFDTEFEIDSSVEMCVTLKLILQPIIENAIKHGISQLSGKGHIKIKVYPKGEDVYFEIIDDGIGFDTERADGKDKLSGYGIKNVDTRIKLEYGDQYGVKVYSKPKGGTRVVLNIKRENSH